VNPLVAWLWIGGLVLALGTLVCVLPLPARREPQTASGAGKKVRA
jgi:cytochrome c biogenesis factor